MIQCPPRPRSPSHCSSRAPLQSQWLQIAQRSQNLPSRNSLHSPHTNCTLSRCGTRLPGVYLPLLTPHGMQKRRTCRSSAACRLRVDLVWRSLKLSRGRTLVHEKQAKPSFQRGKSWALRRKSRSSSRLDASWGLDSLWNWRQVCERAMIEAMSNSSIIARLSSSGRATRKDGRLLSPSATILGVVVVWCRALVVCCSLSVCRKVVRRSRRKSCLYINQTQAWGTALGK